MGLTSPLRWQRLNFCSQTIKKSLIVSYLKESKKKKIVRYTGRLFPLDFSPKGKVTLGDT